MGIRSAVVSFYLKLPFKIFKPKNQRFLDMKSFCQAFSKSVINKGGLRFETSHKELAEAMLFNVIGFSYRDLFQIEIFILGIGIFTEVGFVSRVRDFDFEIG